MVLCFRFLGGKKEFSVTYPVKASIVGGSAFNPGIINCDGSCIAVLANEKGSKDCINVYSSRNGQLISKIIIKTSKVTKRSFRGT